MAGKKPTRQRSSLQDEKGRFLPGNDGNGGGRKPGTPNRTTTLLKDAILQAAADAGGGDLSRYLRGQAKANPGPFMSLLGKVLPMQITSEGTDRIVVEIVKSGRKKDPSPE